MVEEIKMKTIEELRKALLVAKESIEKNLESLNRLEKEEEPVMLHLTYDTKTIPQAALFEVKERSCVVKFGGTSVYKWAVGARVEGPLAGKAFLLNSEYDWELGKDEGGILCLVPLKKEK